MKRTMLCIFGILLLASMNVSAGVMKNAGCRSSSYGADPYPTATEWGYVFLNMASFFPGSTPTGIWIVGTTDAGYCNLEFPSSGGSIANVTFSNVDEHESYLTAFDSKGIKVFLQVESGNADVGALIDAVLNRYKSHSCVAGFGVDVEWYKSSGTGTLVTDAVAQAWESKVKSHNSSYRLFLKHWDPAFMPPAYRGSIIFVNDGQQYSSLNELKTDFGDWASAFSSNTVWYQGGYEEDYTWWSGLANPPKDIGNALLAAVGASQEMGVFWVDFTMHDAKVKNLLFNPSINPSKLKVTVTTVGSGTVTLNPANGSYDLNTSVTATANPGTGAAFVGWSGDVSGTNRTITFTVTRDMAITAQFSSGNSDMLDDFEDNDDVNNLGGAWYAYDDSPLDNGKKGASVITPKPTDTSFAMAAGGYGGSKYAAKVTFTLNHGTLDYDGFVGFGCQLGPTEGKDVNISAASGISFFHKGSACDIKLETSDVKDYAYHFAAVTAHADWALVTVPWANLKQPADWGAPVTLNPAHALAIAWEISGPDGTAGSVYIDNLRLPGMAIPQIGVRDAHRIGTAAAGLAVRAEGRRLFVSCPLRQGLPAKLSIIDVSGKTIEQHTVFKSRSSIGVGSLPAGAYVCKLTQGNIVSGRAFIVSK